MIPGKVSFITAAYNYGHYIEQAIDSALSQTYPDFDVIVVNDGSTDNTLDVLKKFGDRIRVVSQENSGLARTRNKGVSLSDAEFYIQLDADDYVDRDYIEKTIPHMVDPGVGMVATDYLQFGIGSHRVAAQAMTLDMELKGNNIPIASLVRRTAYDQVPGGYTTAFIDRTGNKQHCPWEDWSFWIDLLKRGWKCYPVNEPLFHYRIKTESDKIWRNNPETLDGRGDVSTYNTAIIRTLHPELFK